MPEPSTLPDQTLPSKILVVDDDPAYRRLCSIFLNEAKIEHVQVGSSKEAMRALDAARDAPFDLILLDMELPGMKGWELLKFLRERGRDIPVILVSVLEDVKDKVRAFDVGADDYVVKPFSFEELLSRLQAVMRRSPARNLVQVGELTIDPLLRRVKNAGKTVDLTPREFELLALLIERRGQTVSKEEFLQRVWRMDGEPGTNFLQVHLSRLKPKLTRSRVHIETVHRHGYRLVEDGPAGAALEGDDAATHA